MHKYILDLREVLQGHRDWQGSRAEVAHLVVNRSRPDITELLGDISHAARALFAYKAFSNPA